MTIKDCILLAETLAHLQGKEAQLLPIAEAARSEYVALLEAVGALKEIRKGSAVEGRWLDLMGDECLSGTEGAEWVPYTDEEQAAWVISVTKIADKALEKLS